MSTTTHDIRVISWRADFIAGLAEDLARAPSRLAATRVIFPHNRPSRHLRAALAELPGLPRPCILPRMQALDEFLRSLRQELSPAPLVRAGQLDRIGLLHGIVRGLKLLGGPLAHLDATAREFFPWGARLAGLLDELAEHDASPSAIHNLEGEVLPWASALLSQLDRIAAAYQSEMARRGWTTPGLDAQWLAHNLDAVEAHLTGQHIVFAGFNALAACEEALMRHLWMHAGADIVWHTDPAVATGGPVAWPAREHARWLARWRGRAVVACDEADAQPQVRRLYEGFDLHSQLSVLGRELAALPDTASTAVVLPDPAALVPVMHHLPDREGADVNISMGYPLARSSLAQLIATILALHENANATGYFAWRDLIALVRHPLLRLLRVNDAGETPLRGAYQSFERHIRTSGAWQDPRQWLPAYDAESITASEDEVRALHEEVLSVCCDGFRGLTTLRGAGEALSRLCELLRRRGGDLWQRHLIDAECLLRLWQSVVPELTGSILADEEYDQSLVFMILRHLLDAERVSFEPEPLAGMQVLGMLETRLLRFRRLFVLDASEDMLPGGSAPDPLLPDPLRSALGLPGRRERDQVAAHNFFRLLMGAQQVSIFYQAGVRPGAEGKTERSRYVEQLLWELERRTGKLVEPMPLGEPDAVLSVVSFPASPILPRHPAMALTDELRARLASRLREKGLTPSGLATWLKCPKQAMYRYVLRLRQLDEVAEDGDRAKLGEVVHLVLKNFLAPRLGQPIAADMLDADALCRAFEMEIGRESSFAELPYDVRTALTAAGRERLRRFVANLPPTRVVALEREVLTQLDAAGMDVPLGGRIDRLDERPGGRVVLDYKTGGVKGGVKGWLDDEIFAQLAAAAPGSQEAAQALEALAQTDSDAQLPMYLYLLGRVDGVLPDNAAWVELKSDGGERPLFTDKHAQELRRCVVGERVPLVIRSLVAHLLAVPELPARPGHHCDWCDFSGPCGA
jgi:inactivated superfamily I helicase/RecB family exonuclease